MKIKLASESDHASVWEIFREVIQTGDTYVFDPGTKREDLEALWFAENMKTYIAELDGDTLGTYIIKPNQRGLGSHIANASYMVHPKAHGKGIGKAMCEHSLVEARKLGYLAMQFNLVVSTNKVAVNLWKNFGFEILGTIPNAFNHRKEGYVDAFIMYRRLD